MPVPLLGSLLAPVLVRRAESGVHRILFAAFLVSIALATSTIYSTSALAAGNTNPVDWTVRGTFAQMKIPLRVGQHDSPDGPGFGERHIVDGHGVVPPYDVMGEVMDIANCTSVGSFTNRFICKNDEVTVIFTTNVDERSGDGRPLGIITAFFNAPSPT